MSQKNFEKFATRTKKVLAEGAKKYPKVFTKQVVNNFDVLISETKKTLDQYDLLEEWSVPFYFKTPKDLFELENSPNLVVEEIFKKTKNKKQKLINESVEPIIERPYAKYAELAIIDDLLYESYDQNLAEEYLSWHFYMPAPPLIEEKQTNDFLMEVDASSALAIANAIRLAWKMVPSRVPGVKTPLLDTNSAQNIARQYGLNLNNVADATHALNGNVQYSGGTENGDIWRNLLGRGGEATSTSGGASSTLTSGGGGSLGISTVGHPGPEINPNLHGGGDLSMTKMNTIPGKGNMGILDWVQKLGGPLWGKIQKIWASLTKKLHMAAAPIWTAIKSLLVKGVAFAAAHPVAVSAAIIAAITAGAAGAVLKRRGDRIKKLQVIAKYLKDRPSMLKGGKAARRDSSATSGQDIGREGSGNSTTVSENVFKDLASRAAQYGTRAVTAAREKGTNLSQDIVRRAIDNRGINDFLARANTEDKESIESMPGVRAAVEYRKASKDREKARRASPEGIASRVLNRPSGPSSEGDQEDRPLNDEEAWVEMTKPDGDWMKTNATIRSQIAAVNTLGEWYYSLPKDGQGAVDAYTMDKTKSRKPFGIEIQELKKEFLAMFGDYREAKKAFNQMKDVLNDVAGDIGAGAGMGAVSGAAGSPAAMAGRAIWGGAKAAFKAIPRVASAGLKTAYHGAVGAGKHGFGGIQRGIGAVSNVGVINKSRITEKSEIPSEKQMLTELFILPQAT